eukprot:TRINITY_DN263_c0_g1_i1.p1 TRINITY_DN263_c0_g1~~TRINITY_DN263_c0_g1_i1.p1  ORF type:complete len:215 (-),score=55.58 TRINITY_DN263_c0_g1_i1:81-725(-)
MTTPTLTYFGSRGLAEVLRLVLASVQAEYKEVSVGLYNQQNQPEDFIKIRASGVLDFGALPLWEEDGLQLVQSDAILLHLARKHSLYGNGLNEAAKIDSLYEGIQDVRKAVQDASKAADREVKIKELAEVTLPKWLKYFDEFVQKNGKNGHSVGAQLTYVDVVLFYILETLLDNKISIDSFPALKKLYDVVSSNAGIQAHVKNPKRYPIQIKLF